MAALELLTDETQNVHKKTGITAQRKSFCDCVSSICCCQSNQEGTPHVELKCMQRYATAIFTTMPKHPFWQRYSTFCCIYDKVTLVDFVCLIFHFWVALKFLLLLNVVLQVLVTNLESVNSSKFFHVHFVVVVCEIHGNHSRCSRIPILQVKFFSSEMNSYTFVCQVFAAFCLGNFPNDPF